MKDEKKIPPWILTDKKGEYPNGLYDYIRNARKIDFDVPRLTEELFYQIVNNLKSNG